ncbi:MAG TPA: helix-turn-helix domain-containing protein [Gammaproteobacteria bacterium]|nr:helix-turn-helix domain-containing protein [Gammaproteobacteria bacterium]
MAWAYIDILLRGITMGIALLLGAAFWRASARGFGWAGVMFTAGVVAYLLWGNPDIAASWPLLRLFIGLTAISTPFFFWVLTRLIFDDGFALRPVHWLLLALVEAAAVAYALAPRVATPGMQAYFGAGFRVVSLGLVGHALWGVWAGRPDDLVEARARLRLSFIAVAGSIALYVLLLALFYLPVTERPAGWRVLESALLLLINLVLGARLLHLDREFLPATVVPSPVPQPPGLQALAAARSSTMPAEDGEALQRIDALMSKEKIWRETGLSIGQLAERARLPEYRLRRLINRELGFRNFTAFLNDYRLAAAAERLADPGQLRIPVLSIALDLGWASIGPFNRAFRARFNMTPSDYRRQQLRPIEPA